MGLRARLSDEDAVTIAQALAELAALAVQPLWADRQPVRAPQVALPPVVLRLACWSEDHARPYRRS